MLSVEREQITRWMQEVEPAMRRLCVRQGRSDEDCFQFVWIETFRALCHADVCAVPDGTSLEHPAGIHT